MSFSTRKVALAAAVSFALLTAAGQAAASELTATVTAANEYDFRGISQSAKDPALQMSLDLATDSGFSGGVWASNIDYGPDASEDRELDIYAGWTKAINDDLSFTVNAVYYTYFGDGDFDYPEYNVGLNYKGLSTKLWYSNTYAKSGDSAYYLEAAYAHELPAGFTLTAHVGFSRGDYWKNAVEGVNGEYDDYTLGVSRSFGPITAALKYSVVSTDAAARTHDRVFNNENRVLFQIATTFPWSKD